MCVCCFFFSEYADQRKLHVLTHSFPTRRSSDLLEMQARDFVRAGADAGSVRAFGDEPAEGGIARVFVAHIADEMRQLVARVDRSEEHTSELQSLMRISYAVFCLKKKITKESKQHADTNSTAATYHRE